MQPVRCRIPAPAANQVIPFRDQVAQWAARSSGVAERDPTVHAAAGLLADLRRAFVRILGLVDLTPVTDPLINRPLGRLDFRNLQESLWISHVSPP